MEEGKFIKIDLYIHTPASNCYKGKKDDLEYLRILRNAKSKDIKIIAITDHNSIEGYKRILTLRDKLTSQKEALSLITDSIQGKERMKEIEKELSLFDDILILPGVEFEVSNGIHLLVIFNNTTQVETVEKFLKDSGYPPENFGKENTSALPDWDIFDLYQESNDYDCIIIDAHTDSNKGILNTIPSGNVRANCFKAPQLAAVCYRSEEQKDKLKNVLETSKEYRRKVPISFVKFSDAHISNEIGTDFTWIKVDQIDFVSLTNAFANPSEMVSVEEPSVVRILDKLLRLNNSFGVPDLSDNSKEYFKKVLCALCNSKGGYALFGITKDKKKRGISIKREKTKNQEYDRVFAEISECTEDIEGSLRAKMTLYEMRNDRVIVSVNVRSSDYLTNIKNDDRIYSIKGNRVLTLSGVDIQMLIEERVTENIKSKVSKRLTEVEKDCGLIKNLFASQPIMRSFERNSRAASFDVSVSRSIDLPADEIEKLNKLFANGTSRGNLFYCVEDLVEPRLKYTYLRYTLPLFTIRNISEKPLMKETIYIIPGGGSYYSKRDYPFFIENHIPVLKLYKTKRNAPYGMKFTACFIKSSLLLWYCKSNFETTNLYSRGVFEKLRLPDIKPSDPDTKALLHELEVLFDKIVSLERRFLIETRLAKKKDYSQHAEQHNAQVDDLAYQIDCIIYRLANLSSNDIKTIEEYLGLNDIYLPSKSQPLTNLSHTAA